MTHSTKETMITQLEQWFQEEMPRLYRYVCYRTRDQLAAEEITATTCEKAFRKLDQYNPLRGELRNWMFGIARNELRAYFRSLKKNPVRVPLDQIPAFSLKMQSPEQEYERKEMFTQILNVLATLSEREQEVIALRYGGALPERQIANIMLLKENHIGVLLHRTLDKIKKCLEEISYESK